MFICVFILIEAHKDVDYSFLFFLPFTKVSFDLKASEYQQNSDALLL